MFKFKLFAVLVIACVLGLLIAACTSKTSSENLEGKSKPVEPISKRGTKLGQLAPDFDLTKIDGEKIRFEDLKGQPTVLVFWSAYCVDCEEEAPHINQLAKKLGPKGVNVLGINIGESEARTKGGIKDFGIRYDVALDGGRKVTKEYGVLGTPTVIILDRKGIVRYNGNELPKNYEEILNKLI